MIKMGASYNYFKSNKLTYIVKNVRYVNRYDLSLVFNKSLKLKLYLYNVRFNKWCSAFDTIRTWIQENETFIVPNLDKEINTS